MSILKITGLSHSFGADVLFDNADFTLNRGEHVGVVGRNGAGKSTLIRFCAGALLPDGGQIEYAPRLSLGWLDQHAALNDGETIGSLLHGAFGALYRDAAEMDALYALAADDPDALRRAADLQTKLESQDFYTLDARVEQVMEGLGLAALGADRLLAEMSGGQRAKAILGRLLLQQPDVLLLDEPTNFLDAAHVDWLASYLSGLENAYLVVSHDFDFLNRIATHICDVSGGKITKYSGGYADFVEKKAQREADHARHYAAQQREIRRTEEFIRRNIAGRKTKMAQGRRRQLERMERIAALGHETAQPVFRFASLPAPSTEQLTLRGLAVGYGEPLLQNLSLTVRGGERIALVGFNGVGKSTLLKTLVGQIPPVSGRFHFSPQAVLGYFEQESRWADGARTPVQLMTDAFAGLTPREARLALLRCGLPYRLADQHVETLSGGEQAKVRLCMLTRVPCNFLLLDEPTNHLDDAAKAALYTALESFPGTVLLVSHEARFYKPWANRVIDLRV